MIDTLFWMSYVDADGQSLGACVVPAATHGAAVARAFELGIVPASSIGCRVLTVPTASREEWLPRCGVLRSRAEWDALLPGGTTSEAEAQAEARAACSDTN